MPAFTIDLLVADPECPSLGPRGANFAELAIVTPSKFPVCPG
jgi:hypothetical protein